MRKIVDIFYPKDETVRLLIFSNKDTTYLFGYFQKQDSIADWDEIFEEEIDALNYCKQEFDVGINEWIQIKDPFSNQSIDVIYSNTLKKLYSNNKSLKILTNVAPNTFPHNSFKNNILYRKKYSALTVLSFFAFVAFFFMGLFTLLTENTLVSLYLSLIVFVFLILCLIRDYNKGIIVFYLDRLLQEIVFPKSIHNKVEKKYNLKSIFIDFESKDVYEINDDKKRCLISLFDNESSEYDFVKKWSYVVWFMDKNRPLPLGHVYDSFRKQDFERRKKKGFPEPLYSSKIPTPEATKKQQTERKRVGGW